MKMLCRIIWGITVWLLCLAQYNPAVAQRISGSATLTLDDQWSERIYPISQLEFFEDTTLLLRFDDIVDPAFQQHFRIRPEANKSNFDTRHAYWVKLSVKNNPESKKDWFLEFYDQAIDGLEAYVPADSGRYVATKMGDGVPFNNRLLAHKNFHVKVPNKDPGISNFYFRITSSQKADIRIAVRSVDRFVFYSLNEYFLYGLFYGMIAIIAFYNFLVFLAVREMKYVYYIFYLLSVALYAMSLDGIGFQYLWPNYPWLNSFANGIFSFSIVFWAILFSMRFLNTSRKAPWFHRLLTVSLGLKVATFSAGLWIDVQYFDISYIDVIPFLLIFASSIYLLTRGYKGARFFVMAYGVLFVGAVIKVLVNTAWIEHNTLGYYSLHLAFLIEMVLLSLALGDRIKILKEIRDQAIRRTLEQYKTNLALKEHVTKELEQKVRERTKELEEKTILLTTYNLQLQQKDEEIKRINSLLDKDNWKLKGKVKESLKARLANRRLTIEEFQAIFPDRSACCRYLEDIKWGKTFFCRQCGNKKCSEGAKLFTRRCSKCGYIESVTAGTVFHGIRFPLEKAFFLAYFTVVEGKKRTLEEMCELLSLNKNTVWAFRKRIKDLIEAKGKLSPSWEDILFDEIYDRSRDPMSVSD